MGRYRKKPIVIDAVQFTEENRDEWLALIDTHRVWSKEDGSLDYAIVPTLEGDHRASPGDWIIRGIKGEIYPCREDIFRLTYEQVPDDSPRSAK